MTGLLNRPHPLGGTAGALARYRVMAFIVGTGLALLCFVGIPLQVIGGNKWPWTAVVEIVGPIHGIFYIAYLVTCLDLAGRARFRTTQLLGMVCSGLVPLLAFYMERKVTERVRAQLALGADAPPGPAATIWSVLSGSSRRPAPAEAPRRPESAGPPESGGGAEAAGSTAPAREDLDEAAPASAAAPGQRPGRHSMEGQ
jgi:integral membrane protein